MSNQTKTTIISAAVLVLLAAITWGVITKVSTERAILATASSYYVSQQGSGTTCSQTLPCTWSTGQGKLVPGDTLYIQGSLTTTTTISKSGLADMPIYIVGGSIDAPHSSVDAFVVSGSYLDISNITITGGYEHGVRIRGDYVVMHDFTVTHTVWENFNLAGDACKTGLSGGWGSALVVAYTADRTELYNGQVYENCGEGIAILQATNTYVHDSLSYSNWSRDVYIGNAPNVTIERVDTTCTNPGYYRSSGQKGFGLAIESRNYSLVGNQLHDIIIRDGSVTSCQGINFYSEVANQYPSNVLVDRVRFVDVPEPVVKIPGTNIVVIPYEEATLTPTATLTETPTPTASATATYVPTDTATATATATDTPTATPTPLCQPPQVAATLSIGDAPYYWCLIPVP